MNGDSLSAQLSHVLGLFTAQLEDADGPSLAVWSNVLRCVGDGIDEKDLAPAARISTRLATAAVTGSARRGWVTAEPAKGKNRRVLLTKQGQAAAQQWVQRLEANEWDWRQSDLRAALEELVGRLPFELPHFPASYGAADPSAIGGPYVQQAQGKRVEGIPAHGKDWAPVPRTDGDTVASLPITALLSQALMAFTIDYEDRFPWPLANTVTVLAHLSSEPRPLADVPGDHEISGTGKSLVERHLIAAVTKEGSRKLVALTDRGELVMQHHPKRLAAVEAEWLDRFGGRLMTSLRAALDAVKETITRPYPDHVIAHLHNG
jgi:hypothetical protein